eukprot:2458-Amphidinium_carterae.1
MLDHRFLHSLHSSNSRSYTRIVRALGGVSMPPLLLLGLSVSTPRSRPVRRVSHRIGSHKLDLGFGGLA